MQHKDMRSYETEQNEVNLWLNQEQISVGGESRQVSLCIKMIFLSLFADIV